MEPYCKVLSNKVWINIAKKKKISGVIFLMKILTWCIFYAVVAHVVLCTPWMVCYES